MSRNFRILLIILSLATIMVAIVVISPRLLSMYYQMTAADLVTDAARKAQVDSEFDVFCTTGSAIQQNNQVILAEAIKKLNRSILYDRKNSQAYLYLGRAYCLSGDPDHAIDNYQIFVNLRPDNPLGYLGLGFAYEAAGDIPSAVDYWKKAGIRGQDFVDVGFQNYDAGRFNEADSWFMRALKIDPQLASAWQGIGKVNEEQRSFNEAIQAYQNAWSISPAISTTDYLRVLKQRGAQRKIIDILTRSLNEVPQSPDRLIWWRELGNTLSSQGKWDEAVEIYTIAISEFPQDPNLYIDLGRAMYNRGDSIEQVKVKFEDAIRLDERSADGYYALAQILTRYQKYQEAEQFYVKAIDLAPDHRWYYISEADNLRLAGNLNDAIDRYREITSLFPDFSHGYYQLALAYSQNGQVQEAITAIEKAIELMNPPLDTYYARAGDIYLSAGLNEKAIDAYNEALKINPKNTSVLRNIELINQD